MLAEYRKETLMKMHHKDLRNVSVAYLWEGGPFLRIQFIKRMPYLCCLHILASPLWRKGHAG